MLFDIVQCASISAIIFTLGMCGIAPGRKNIIIMLMSIESMLLAAGSNLLILSVSIDDPIGQLSALLVLTVAAAESAIGSATPVTHPRIRGTISVQSIHFIKG